MNLNTKNRRYVSFQKSFIGVFVGGGRRQSLMASLGAMIPAGSLVRSVAILGGGTALGQAIIVLSTPLLTRLFTPADFGVLAVFISIVSIFIKAIAWRYEQAIPLAAEEDTAVALLALSLAITCLSVFLIWVFSTPMASLTGLLGNTGALPYLWLLPLGVAGAGLYQVFGCWGIREKAFSVMASVRVGQSAAIVCGQLLGALIWNGPLGLLFGDILGRMTGSTLFVYMLWRRAPWKSDNLSISRIYEAASRYWRFPALSLGATLLGDAALSLPPILFAVYYGSEVAGWFALAVRIIGGPSLLVGQAVGQVYWGEAAGRIRRNPLTLGLLFKTVVTKLFLIFLLPMVVLGLVAPPLFAVVFGEVWRPAGEFAQYLAVPFLFRVVVAPVSETLNILEKQDWQLYWDIFRLVLVVGSIIVAHQLKWSALGTTKLYALASTIGYSSIIFLSMHAIRRHLRQVKHTLKDASQAEHNITAEGP